MISNYCRIAATVLVVFSVTSMADNSDTVTIGTVRVVASEQSIIVPCKKVLDSGLVEYLGVTTSGKTYESALSIACDPADFHAALLLINAKPGSLTYTDNQAKREVKSITGDTVDLEIWYGFPTPVNHMPASALFEFRDPALRKDEAKIKKKFAWIFTGSREVPVDSNKRLVHETIMSGSLIAVLPDEGAEINLSYITESPYASPTAGFRVKPEAIRQIAGMPYLKISNKNRSPQK